MQFKSCEVCCCVASEENDIIEEVSNDGLSTRLICAMCRYQESYEDTNTDD